MRIDELTRRDWSDRSAAPCGLADGFHAVRWTDCDLDALTPAWNALAGMAATPNPFFESWFLRPSLEQFDPGGKALLTALVHESRLVGLMPLSRQWSRNRLPLPTLATWVHANIFCGAALVLAEHARDFWSALLDWADRNAGQALHLHLSLLPRESEVCEALEAVCFDQRRSCHIVQREHRALMRRGLSPQDHLTQSIAKKQRKELARKRRRLAEAGELVVARHTDSHEIASWIEDFLALEKSGWKGREGSALACDRATATLFRDAMTEAARLGRLERLAFTLDGHPVAMLCTFLAPPGSFGFKTSFDETLASLSPGVLLQVENLDLLNRSDIAWSDSCAAADHPMIDKIWRDRREMVSINVAIGGTVRRSLGGALAKFEAARMAARA